jgi:hypothetical protein
MTVLAVLLGLLTVAEATRQAARGGPAWAAGCVALVWAVPLAAGVVAAAGGWHGAAVTLAVLVGGLAYGLRG